MKFLLPIIILIFWPLCSLAEIAELDHDGVSISVKHESKTIKKEADKHFLYGKIKIINTTSSIKEYSNKNLTLSIGNKNSRTYLDSIASQAIDFTSISIKPGEEVNINVYWSFKQPLSTQGSHVKLQWKQ